jgi:DNA polymerase-3 subunit gamma/tau
VHYEVIARKYRPQTFADVAGQEIASRTLANAIRKGKVAHAYLFTGPRGVGKTSMARILAKALCCESGPTTSPCGVCEHCRMIAGSHHPDVLEVDAARFGHVEDVKELCDNALFSPSSARMRIYILDEVHMLSTAAWNALLKVLEEPPPHLRFIFATTEVDKVLPTVLSRVQRFDFRPIPLEGIVACLRDIAAKEGQQVADPVLFRLARAAGGGMRDAQTLLDQLLAVGGEQVSEDDLDLLLGSARGGDVAALVGLLVEGRPAPALEALDRACAGGAAPAVVLEQLVDHVRAMLLVQACGRDSQAVRRLGTCTAEVEAHAKACSPEKAIRLCQILIGCQQSLRQGVDPRLQLEVACVRMAALGQVQDLDGLLRRIERLETAPPPAVRPR